MRARPQIPAIENVQDNQVTRILVPVKLILERMTGRAASANPIKTLGPDATLAGVINKVNEIIARLQDS